MSLGHDQGEGYGLTPEEHDALIDRVADRTDGTPHDARLIERVHPDVRARYRRPHATSLPRPDNDGRPAHERRAA